MMAGSGRTLGAVLGGLAIGNVEGLVSSLIGNVLTGAGRDNVYTGNRLAPNLYPDLGTVFRLFWGGLIGETEAQKIAVDHGIDWSGISAPPNPRRPWWAPVIQSYKGWFSPEDYRLWYRQGRIGKPDLQRVMAYHGFDPLLGFTDSAESELDTWIESTEPLDWMHILILWRRGVIDTNQFKGYLAALGIVDPDDQAIMLNLKDEIPTITDHLHWLARNVDDPEYTSQFLLWAGFDTKPKVIELYTQIAEATATGSSSTPEFRRVIQAIERADIPELLQRRNFWDTFRADLESQGMRKRDALFHYLAHWKNPAPTEAARFLWRLRPGRVEQLTGQIMGAPFDPTNPEHTRRAAALRFDADKFRRVLVEQDVSPSMVDRFLATVYHPLPIRFLRQLFDTGAWSRDQAGATLLDLGHSATDTEFALRALETQKKRLIATQAHGLTVAAIQEQYRDGLIDDAAYLRLIQLLGFSADVALESLGILRERMLGAVHKTRIAAIKRAMLIEAISPQEARDQLATVARSDYARELIWQEWQAELSLRQTERAAREREHLDAERVAAIRRCFETGHLSAGLAAVFLGELQMEDRDISAHLSLWTFERACHSKLPSKDQLVSAAKRGQVGINQLAAVLAAEDYSPEAIALAIADVVFHIGQEEVKAAKADDAAHGRLARAFARQLREARKVAAKEKLYRFDLEKAFTQAQLKIDLAKLTDKIEKANLAAGIMRQIAEAHYAAREPIVTG